MNELHDTPAKEYSTKHADFKYTMAIFPKNFGTRVIRFLNGDFLSWRLTAAALRAMASGRVKLHYQSETLTVVSKNSATARCCAGEAQKEASLRI